MEVKHYVITLNEVDEVFKLRDKLLAKLDSLLDHKEKLQALQDGHAKREPRPCGMTVHTGIGCKNRCLYCYVPDMGFSTNPRPYPLNGLQLVYALLNNPFFVPGKSGTLIAFGSVTEPFLPETKKRAIEYLETVSKYLGNPIQLATKAYIDPNMAKLLRAKIEPQASFLVTIVTLRHAKRLEPNAPPPEKRLETIYNLSRQGFHVTLFLRPIIPGITDREVDEIISRAASAGARGVVPGSLRVTPGILDRLKRAGFSINPIVSRLPRWPRNPRDQVTIKESDLKMLVNPVAAKHGLKVYPSSCAANIDSHGLGCYSCKWGLCGLRASLPEVNEDAVAYLCEKLGVYVKRVKVTTTTVHITVDRRYDREKLRVVKHWVTTLTRRSLALNVAR